MMVVVVAGRVSVSRVCTGAIDDRRGCGCGDGKEDGRSFGVVSCRVVLPSWWLRGPSE